jgi:hypothetical protein
MNTKNEWSDEIAVLKEWKDGKFDVSTCSGQTYIMKLLFPL